MKKHLRTSPIWLEPKELFQERVNQCSSIADIVRSFGYAIGSANYKTIHSRIAEDSIDISHISLDRKGVPHFDQRRPLSDYLYSGSTIQSHTLKLRLIRDGVLKNLCSECGLSEIWNDKPISLHIDHINGIRDDNRLENLRLLCPNCHSQTTTYSGKHRKVIYSCIDCGAQISSKLSQRCQPCANKQNAILYPQSTKLVITKEELELLVWQKPVLQIAKDFGVSDKAIEKRCRKYSIVKPARGYWQKQQKRLPDGKFIPNTI